MKRTYTKKNGDVVVHEYDQASYNKVFYEKNRDKLLTRVVCDCGLSYLETNKHNHNKGRVHSLYSKLVIDLGKT